ncbi:MAG: cell division protein FtsA [Fidelibacterota bacterium]
MRKLAITQDKGIRVGLDIGTTKICCIISQLEHDDDSMKLLGAGIGPAAGIRKGMIVNVDEAVDSIEKAVRKAEKMAGQKVNSAYIGISGDHIRGINTQGAIAIAKNGHHAVYDHEITSQDINRALELARAVSLPVDREILHILPQEYIVDEQRSIKDPSGMVARRLEAKVHLVTGAITAAKNIRKCVEEAGIDVNALIYQPLASAAATLEPTEKQLGVALVDIGGGTTDVSVFFDGGVRHSAVIALGGNNITNDIALMLQVSLEDAEEIKIKHASAKAAMASTDLDFELSHQAGESPRVISEHEVSRYVEARMEEILQLVNREIMRADVEGPVSFGIVLTGGGALLKNVTSLAEEVLGGRVKIGIPKGLNSLFEIAASPVYATAIGLIQYGEQIAEEFNLGSPEKLTGTRTISRLKHWFSGMF